MTTYTGCFNDVEKAIWNKLFTGKKPNCITADSRVLQDGNLFWNCVALFTIGEAYTGNSTVLPLASGRLG